MIKKGIVAATLVLLCCSPSFSQYQDFECWTELSAETEVVKDFEVALTEEFRFNQNASYFNDWLNTLSIMYKINKYFKAGGGYRFGIERDLENVREYHHRFYAEGSAKYKFDRLTYYYRLRYQADYSQIYSSDDGTTPEVNLRNRLLMNYNIPKIPLFPFISYEFFYRLNNPDGNSIEANRYTLGLEYCFFKDLSASAYYRIQTKRGNNINPKNIYILGASLNYSF